MRPIELLFSILFVTSSVAAATPEEERAQLREVAAEVAARRVVREHESGKRKVADTELAAARLLILKASEKRARAVAAGPNESFLVDLKAADMATVTKIWKGVFGFDVVIADGVKDKEITLSVS